MIKIKKNAGDYDNRRVRVNETDFTLEEILEGRKRILESSEEFKLVYKEFERLKKSKNNKITYPKWYSVFDGPKSIWGLATELRQEDLYEHLYTNLSSNTHSSDVISGKMSTDLNDKAEIIQLRSWQNANTVTKLTLSITILVFREYIDKRIPKYNTEYKEWFATIRDDFSRL